MFVLMLPAPAVLTPERIDAMLSRTAEICMAGVEEAGERLRGAEDIEGFERAGRTLQALGRNLRQTIALKQRFDREQAGIAAAQRREAEDLRRDAQRAQRAAVDLHRMRVRRHFERVLWDEYEDDDAQEIFEDLDDRLGQFADDEAFVDTPIETLIARLTDEFVAAAAEDESSGDESPGDESPGRVAPETAAATPPPSVADEASGPDEDAPIGRRAVESIPRQRVDPEPPPDLVRPDPRPPDSPPDPLPEPYIPPWDRVPPGAAMRGGSGW